MNGCGGGGVHMGLSTCRSPKWPSFSPSVPRFFDQRKASSNDPGSNPAIATALLSRAEFPRLAKLHYSSL